jgi:hypothetical protein
MVGELRMSKNVIGTAMAALVAFQTPAAAIVGGAKDESPLARASVMVLSSKGGVCSAVVVARDVVLTAAHCVTGAPEYRVHWRDEEKVPVLVKPAAKAVHPGYDAKAVTARRMSIDLALVRLPEPLPDRFAVATLTASVPLPEAGITVAGWGMAREGDIRSTGTFRSAALRAVAPYGPSRILLWAEGDGAGACQGDSGGMLAMGDTIAAVTSWSGGSGRRRCGSLTQGILVGPQRAWIDRVLEGWDRAALWE